MSSIQAVSDLIVISLDAMKNTGPMPLLKRIGLEAQMHDLQVDSPAEALASAIGEVGGDSRLHGRLRQELAFWDAADAAAWTDGTTPKTPARRESIYDALALPTDMRAGWTELFPIATAGGEVVISAEFEPWYAASLSSRTPFYWQHYEDYLITRGWHPDAIAALRQATTRVVERLADPERKAAYQSKGLVVGYVQSGKTANFTGVIAKAIDAGYRLIIVLTGTTDLLRAQTQRRVDKELVGQENLLRGVKSEDPDALATVDYFGDPDWGGFVRHGELPSVLGHPDIQRLTTTDSDYRKLRQGIEALDFQRFVPTKPLNDPENLRRLPARLAIVKKNATRLADFVKDLNKITARLADIPALVVDDESDQASLNTTNPAKWKQGSKDRTTINRHVSELLRLLPRGQYVGYTATPFANVFVDPSDARDIFPSSFILSLDRPPGYMGARDFHDLDGTPDPDTVATSNERAFVRDVVDDDDRDTLREAIDAFVLAGALKLFRRDNGGIVDARHHTMLVHESVTQAAHRELAEDIREIWTRGAWMLPKAAARLEKLYEKDFLPVMTARSDGEPVPSSFQEVKKYIGQVAAAVAGSDANPVWIVNGDKEVAEHNIDFGARSIWKILVGGTKLSRGFTIEGLTVSYYVRLTAQADTLMQMGRWFGFRPGYHDLVRLYVGRASPATGRPTRDIYDAFEAACRSEEMFRDEIRRYAELIDGKPQVTPAEIPPLVAQHVPWLKPTARSKMYNAVLVERRSPGARIEPTGYPQDAKSIAHNADAVKPLILAATEPTSLQMSPTSRFGAFYWVVSHAAMVGALEQLLWAPSDHFAADLEWLRHLGSDKITDWVVVLPQLVGSAQTRELFGLARSVHERSRREGRALFGGIADPKHRLAADRIASNADAGTDDAARELRSAKRGAVLIYPVFELKDTQTLPEHVDPAKLIMGLMIAAPRSTGSPDQPLVRFRTHDPSRTDAIIDA
jgi:Z1 domain